MRVSGLRRVGDEWNSVRLTDRIGQNERNTSQDGEQKKNPNKADKADLAGRKTYRFLDP